MPPVFNYEPLGPDQDAIRLVMVEPCFGPPDEITCTLHDAHARTNNSYTALSYMWGKSSSHDPRISLDGKPFFVTANLWSFLYHARTALPGRYLWIDAMCIDQTNARERNQQVTIMGDIYTNANLVIAWLGADDHKLDSLFVSMLQNQIRSGRQGKAIPAISRLEITSQKHDYYSHVDMPHDVPDLSWIPPGMVHLLLLPYWQRAWIVQELLLAKNLSFMYGECIVKYNFLVEALVMHSVTHPMEDEVAAIKICEYYRHQRLSHSDLPSSLRLLLQRADSPGTVPRRSIHQMVQVVQGTECQEPRDHVYSLLSLVHMGRTFPVDYRQPLATFALQVFHHFEGDLQLLDRVLYGLKLKAPNLYAIPVLEASGRRSRSSGTARASKPDTVISFEVLDTSPHAYKPLLRPDFQNAVIKDSLGEVTIMEPLFPVSRKAVLFRQQYRTATMSLASSHLGGQSKRRLKFVTLQPIKERLTPRLLKLMTLLPFQDGPIKQVLETIDSSPFEAKPTQRMPMDLVVRTPTHRLVHQILKFIAVLPYRVLKLMAMLPIRMLEFMAVLSFRMLEFMVIQHFTEYIIRWILKVTALQLTKDEPTHLQQYDIAVYAEDQTANIVTHYEELSSHIMMAHSLPEQGVERYYMTFDTLIWLMTQQDPRFDHHEHSRRTYQVYQTWEHKWGGKIPIQGAIFLGRFTDMDAENLSAAGVSRLPIELPKTIDHLFNDRSWPWSDDVDLEWWERY